jgi:hypothetical protein
MVQDQGEHVRNRFTSSTRHALRRRPRGRHTSSKRGGQLPNEEIRSGESIGAPPLGDPANLLMSSGCDLDPGHRSPRRSAAMTSPPGIPSLPAAPHRRRRAPRVTTRGRRRPGRRRAPLAPPRIPRCRSSPERGPSSSLEHSILPPDEPRSGEAPGRTKRCAPRAPSPPRPPEMRRRSNLRKDLGPLGTLLLLSPERLDKRASVVVVPVLRKAFVQERSDSLWGRQHRFTLPPYEARVAFSSAGDRIVRIVSTALETPSSVASAAATLSAERR